MIASACGPAQPPAYIDRYNERPKPTVWSASATDILEKVKRAQAALLKVTTSEALH